MVHHLLGLSRLPSRTHRRTPVGGSSLQQQGMAFTVQPNLGGGMHLLAYAKIIYFNSWHEKPKKIRRRRIPHSASKTRRSPFLPPTFASSMYLSDFALGKDFMDIYNTISRNNGGNTYRPRASVYPTRSSCNETSTNPTVSPPRLASRYNCGRVQCNGADGVLYGGKLSSIRQYCQTTISNVRPTLEAYGGRQEGVIRVASSRRMETPGRNGILALA